MRYLPLKQFAKHVTAPRNSLRPIAGLDVGKELVGVAWSDETKTFVTPGLTLKRKHPRNSPEAVKAFATRLGHALASKHVCGLVVGLPIGRDDAELTPLAREIINLMDGVAQCAQVGATITTTTTAPDGGVGSGGTGLGSLACAGSGGVDLLEGLGRDVAFTFWDERYSTFEARRLMSAKQGGRKGRYQQEKDRVAAAFILQGFQESMLGGGQWDDQ